MFTQLMKSVMSLFSNDGISVDTSTSKNKKTSTSNTNTDKPVEAENQKDIFSRIKNVRCGAEFSLYLHIPFIFRESTNIIYLFKIL